MIAPNIINLEGFSRHLPYPKDLMANNTNNQAVIEDGTLIDQTALTR
jgi:hypothetical protein